MHTLNSHRDLYVPSQYVYRSAMGDSQKVRMWLHADKQQVVYF